MGVRNNEVNILVRRGGVRTWRTGRSRGTTSSRQQRCSCNPTHIPARLARTPRERRRRLPGGLNLLAFQRLNKRRISAASFSQACLVSFAGGAAVHGGPDALAARLPPDRRRPDRDRYPPLRCLRRSRPAPCKVVVPLSSELAQMSQSRPGLQRLFR